MPSEYNHFEGALAIAAQLPTLIIKSYGVFDRGITWDGGGRLIVYLPEKPDEAYFRSTEFRNHFDHWRQSVEERKDVFLGYSSGAEDTANAIIKYLSSIDVSVMDWATDFQAGPSILERIEEAAQTCLCGIFLFTQDDRLEGNSAAAAPRDNVVLEAGYFLRAKGRDRVALIVEKGAKVPADVAGNIYISLEDRRKVALIETKLQRFLKNAL
jgi:predicted nucleotide-binding protein